MTGPCAHACWEPIQGWHGRYRCRDCKALAYKKIIFGDLCAGTAHQMKVYTCRTKACPNPAVTHKNSHLCADCAEVARKAGKEV